MKQKKKVVTVVAYSILLLVIAGVNIKLNFITIPSSEEMASRQIDYITISTVFAGFSFTALGLLPGIISIIFAFDDFNVSTVVLIDCESTMKNLCKANIFSFFASFIILARVLIIPSTPCSLAKRMPYSSLPMPSAKSRCMKIFYRICEQIELVFLCL